MRKILAILVCMVCMSFTMVGCGDNMPTSNSDKNEEINPLVNKVLNIKLVDRDPISCENSPVDTFVPEDIVAPINVLSSDGEIATSLTIDRSNSSGYGGGQFISKLFTEGLSRAAYGVEYSAFQNYLIENGCNAESLKVLAEAVFTSTAFNSFNLANREIAFCVYRAILSRDPSNDELATFSKKNLLKTIENIIKSEEFLSILPDIVFGPYFWRGNNENGYTDGSVITHNEFINMLTDASDTKVVELPQGALILVDQRISLPEGYTLKTQGQPDHYIKFARFLNTKSGGGFILQNNTCLQNVFVDPNSIIDGESRQASIIGGGNNVVVWGNRFTNVHSNPDTTKYYIANNLVTRYETNHMTAWADGIDVYSNDSIVEYNHVVDATDGGIVIFRNHIGTGGYQNSVVRYNLICNTGNSAYVGLDHEGVDGDGEIEDFTGTIGYNNEFYTSYVAHMHMCITLTSRPWTYNFNKNKGVSIYNNYCAEGCFVNTAGGIVAEGIENGVVRGNQFIFNIGEWAPNYSEAHAYSVNTSESTGDFQLGYKNLAITSFVVRTETETADNYSVNVIRIFEDFQNIPSNKFNWN